MQLASVQARQDRVLTWRHDVDRASAACLLDVELEWDEEHDDDELDVKLLGLHAKHTC